MLTKDTSLDLDLSYHWVQNMVISSTNSLILSTDIE